MEKKSMELSVSMPQDSGIVFVNESHCFVVSACVSAGAVLEWTLTSDKSGGAYDKKTINLSAGQSFEESIPVPYDEPSFWELCARVLVDGEIECEEFGSIAVVEEPYDYMVHSEKPFFGAMFVSDGRAAAKTGVKIERLQAYWRIFEPVPGEYDWTSLDNGFKTCTENGISIMLTLRPELEQAPFDMKWTGYKDPYDLLKEPIASYHRHFVKVVMERYKGKIDMIELLNESDLEYMSLYEKPFNDAVDFVAQLNKQLYQTVKAIDPQMPIVGLSTSGEVLKNGHAFPLGVLDHGAEEQFDRYVCHPYPLNRNITETDRFDYPEDFGLREHMLFLQDEMEKRGLTREIGCSEIGYSFPSKSRPLCKSTMEMAQAGSHCLIEFKSIPGFLFTVWFDFDFHWDKNEPDSSFIRADDRRYAYPFVNVFSATARILHGAQPMGGLDLGSEVRAWGFVSEQTGRAIVALWSNETGYRLDLGDTDGIQPLDWFGRRLDKKSFVLDRKPLYITAAAGDYDMLSRTVSDARLVNDEQMVIRRARLSSVNMLNLEIVNRTGEAVTAFCSAAADGTADTKEIVLSPGQNSVELPLGGVCGKELDITVRSGEVEAKRLLNTEFLPLPYISKRECDGDIAFLEQYQPIVLDTISSVVPPDRMCGWLSAEDMNVRAWLGWNEERLYFALRVHDPVHSVDPGRMATFWENDSIQMLIDYDNDSFTEKGDGDIYLNFLDVNGKVLVIDENGESMGDFGVFTREGEQSVYEISVPWERCGAMPPNVGKISRINFIVNQSNGKGRQYFMKLSSGLGTGISPDGYREFVFLKP